MSGPVVMKPALALPAAAGARRRVLLVVSSGLKLGGVEKYARDFRAALQALPGVAVRACTLHDGPGELVRAWGPGSVGCRLTGRTLPDRGWFAARTVAEAARWRPDEVVVLLPGLAPVGAAAAAVCRARMTVVVYGTEVWERMPRLKHASVARAARLLTISRLTLERFREAQGLELPWALLPPAVDVERYRGVRGPVLGDPREVVLLSVSRLDAHEQMKGQDHLIRALHRLGGRLPDGRSLRYRVVGDGTDRPRLEALVRDLGMEAHVEFLGRLDDEALRRAYAGADMFAMPARGEGFGIVFGEALSAGLPVLCGNTDAAREIVSSPRLGRAVPPTDAAAIAGALVEIAADPWFRSPEFAPFAARSVDDRFGPDAFAHQVRAIFAPTPVAG